MDGIQHRDRPAGKPIRQWRRALPARFGLGSAERAAGRGHGKVLGYFACLGASYVLVEMVLV